MSLRTLCFSWRRRQRLLILAATFLCVTFVFLLYGPFWSERLSLLPSCSPSNSHRPILSVGEFIVNDKSVGGLGNRLWEMTSFFMLVRHLGSNLRDAAIAPSSATPRYRSVIFDVFPSLRQNLASCQASEIDALELEVGKLPDLVFTDIPALLDTMNPEWNKKWHVRLDKVNLLQSHRYFYGGREEVLEMLKFPEEAEKHANEVMVPGMRDTNTNVCIHTRRSDFLYQKLHLHSTANFTRQATLDILSRLGRQPNSLRRLIVFGMDANWAKDVFSDLPESAEIDYPVEFISDSPVHEWTFARLHCDAVLQTAPLSTFGWWLGFFSRNQSNVFYGSKFYREEPRGGFNREDFVLPEWQEITNYDDIQADIPWHMRNFLIVSIVNRIRLLLRDFNPLFRP